MVILVYWERGDALHPNIHWEALMAAGRDQAARILRAEPDRPDGGLERDGSAVLADQLRAHVAEEAARHQMEAPVHDKPAIHEPANERPATAPAAGVVAAAQKSGRRKLVLMGVGVLLALAASGYGV